MINYQFTIDHRADFTHDSIQSTNLYSQIQLRLTSRPQKKQFSFLPTIIRIILLLPNSNMEPIVFSSRFESQLRRLAAHRLTVFLIAKLTEDEITH